MKTIAQTLKDEILYPVGEGFIGNRLLARGLDPEADITTEVYNCASFQGAIADSLLSLIEAPNFSETDISISLTDKNLILKKANDIYRRIGEDERNLLEPRVYIGG